MRPGARTLSRAVRCAGALARGCDAVLLDLYRTWLLPAIHAQLMSLGGVSALR
jgi:hypothetical protein